MSTPNPPFVNQPEVLLDRALDTLRRETQTLDTPLYVEKQLMAAFASTTAANRTVKPRSTTQRGGFAGLFGQWFAPGAAIAASVGMASWMMLSPLSQVASDAGADATAIAYANDDANPFIALQPLERIALEPTPRLIAANVPRTSLAAYGLPINPETAGQSVRTEMLVAANGQPLAMRFLP